MLVCHNSVARRFIAAVTFATSQLVWVGACVCWFSCPAKSPFGSSFTLALQCPFFLKPHSQVAKSFTKFFWSIFIYPSLISFRYLCSVAVNSISTQCCFEWNEINAVLFKLYGMFVSEFNHSHRKWKGSLEGSLGRVLLSAALGFPKVLVPRLSQHRKVRMVKTTVFFMCDQLFGALMHLNFIILILIFF